MNEFVRVSEIDLSDIREESIHSRKESHVIMTAHNLFEIETNEFLNDILSSFFYIACWECFRQNLTSLSTKQQFVYENEPMEN